MTHDPSRNFCGIILATIFFQGFFILFLMKENGKFANRTKVLGRGTGVPIVRVRIFYPNTYQRVE